MEILRNNEEILLKVRLTRDEISDAIAVLEALRKDIPIDNSPRNAKAKEVEKFLKILNRREILIATYKEC